MNVAVIPARGGSKRVSRKNIRSFAGSPIISYSIRAAIDSGCFDRVIVSTDSREIADIASSYGAEIPFQRRADLADDSTPLMPVLWDAIDQISATADEEFNQCFCIYPTAPFVTAKMLSESVGRLEKSDEFDFVLAITEFSYPPQRALEVQPSGCVKFINEQFASQQSQEMQTVMHDAGIFFGGDMLELRKSRTVLHGRCMPYVVPNTRCRDIDTLDDWQIAEAIYATIEGKNDDL